MFSQLQPWPKVAFTLLLLSAFPVSAQDSTSVSVARLSEIAVYPQKTAAATVVSLNETEVSTEIDARIEAIPVRVGEVVEKGTLLAKLDCTDYLLVRDETEARVASLDARVELAEKRLRRTEKLTRQQTVAEELLDQRSTELATLQAERRGVTAQLQRARANVGRCELVSPLHAVVTRRPAAEGEFAERGTPVLELVDMENVEIAAQVPVGDVGQIRSMEQIGGWGGTQGDGQIGTMLFFEDSAGRYPLILRTVVPTVNSLTRNREVRLVFAEDAALPGAAGKLVWRDRRPHVSGKLLLRRGGALGVFLYVDGQARFHRLEQAQQGRASVVDFPPDTRVITEGQFSLRDGQKVKRSR